MSMKFITVYFRIPFTLYWVAKEEATSKLVLVRKEFKDGLYEWVIA